MNNFVSNLAEEGVTNAWIGGFRLDPQPLNTTVFAWVDGSNFEYTNFASGEPNNNVGEEFCLQTGFRDFGEWNDEPCSNYKGNVKGFVCQIYNGKCKF